ncbi:glutaredoxin family protein [Urinicoccus massiliensis]|uniref:glutaredoxin family protein n=1 Tax=Urinicoccus massiliensis TaxID=1723382 RepID=UPI0005101D94|nr:glutaredoxin [Urinicoccus massiliensis]KGF07389.1 glutaredoxin [Tissierellia bacterium S5-A11]
MENLRLFTSTYCPYCERVKLVMENKGITGVEIINIDTDPDMRDYLIEKGGKKQVPCLFIGDQAMYESQDIINYLESHC